MRKGRRKHKQIEIEGHNMRGFTRDSGEEEQTNEDIRNMYGGWETDKDKETDRNRERHTRSAERLRSAEIETDRNEEEDGRNGKVRLIGEGMWRNGRSGVWSMSYGTPLSCFPFSICCYFRRRFGFFVMKFCLIDNGNEFSHSTQCSHCHLFYSPSASSILTDTRTSPRFDLVDSNRIHAHTYMNARTPRHTQAHTQTHQHTHLGVHMKQWYALNVRCKAGIFEYNIFLVNYELRYRLFLCYSACYFSYIIIDIDTALPLLLWG